MHNDSLYRVSLKCLILNPAGQVLVVQENNRGCWDLPGGGMDHGENLQQTIARELKEEVSYQGDFKFEILTVDNPVKLITRDIWQIKLIFRVWLDSPGKLAPGVDAEKIDFINPNTLKDSTHLPEQDIYRYAKML